ncbi:hypothetical protein CYMTET_24106, partial [Cymbomonas tetramitiformis]
MREYLYCFGTCWYWICPGNALPVVQAFKLSSALTMATRQNSSSKLPGLQSPNRSISTSKIILGCIAVGLVSLQGWRWSHHQAHQHRSREDLNDWLYHPKLYHQNHSLGCPTCPSCSKPFVAEISAAGCPEVDCPEVECPEVNSEGQNFIDRAERNQEDCHCAPCPKKKCPEHLPCEECVCPPPMNFADCAAYEIEQTKLLATSDPGKKAKSPENDRLQLVLQELQAEREARKKAEEYGKEVEKSRAQLELRLRTVKRALVNSTMLADEIQVNMATERQRCSDRLYMLMSTTLKQRTQILDCKNGKKGNKSEDASFSNPKTFTAPPPFVYPPPLLKEDAQGILNETVMDMMQRRLKEAVLDLREMGMEVSDELIKELEESPELTQERIPNREGESARDEWIQQLRDANAYILKDMEIQLMDPIARSRLLARTPDAERVFPQLFNGTEAAQSITGPKGGITSRVRAALKPSN